MQCNKAASQVKISAGSTRCQADSSEPSNTTHGHGMGKCEDSSDYRCTWLWTDGRASDRFVAIAMIWKMHNNLILDLFSRSGLANSSPCSPGQVNGRPSRDLGPRGGRDPNLVANCICLSAPLGAHRASGGLVYCSTTTLERRQPSSCRRTVFLSCEQTVTLSSRLYNSCL